jgi:hypothetical protein
MRQGGSYGKIKLHLRRDASRYRSGRSREARPWRVLRARAAVGTPVQWRPMRRRPRGLGAVFVGAWWRILATVLSLGLHANISRSAPRGVCRVIAGAPSRRGAGVCVKPRGGAVRRRPRLRHGDRSQAECGPSSSRSWPSPAMGRPRGDTNRGYGRGWTGQAHPGPFPISFLVPARLSDDALLT